MGDDGLRPIQKFRGGVAKHVTWLVDWYDLDRDSAACELREIADRLERGDLDE